MDQTPVPTRHSREQGRLQIHPIGQPLPRKPISPCLGPRLARLVRTIINAVPVHLNPSQPRASLSGGTQGGSESGSTTCISPRGQDTIPFDTRQGPVARIPASAFAFHLKVVSAHIFLDCAGLYLPASSNRLDDPSSKPESENSGSSSAFRLAAQSRSPPARKGRAYTPIAEECQPRSRPV